MSLGNTSVHPRFIVLEGIDGSGKSTQMDAIAQMLEARGGEVVLTREPAGTKLGERIRELVLDETVEIPPVAELALMVAARLDHVENVVEPALKAGKWVVCDRYAQSTYAYNMSGRKVYPHPILYEMIEMSTRGVEPALTLVFNIDPADAERRLDGRTDPKDRIEARGGDFMREVAAGYMDILANDAELFRDWHVVPIDAGQSIDRMREAVKYAVSRLPAYNASHDLSPGRESQWSVGRNN